MSDNCWCYERHLQAGCQAPVHRCTCFDRRRSLCRATAHIKFEPPKLLPHNPNSWRTCPPPPGIRQLPPRNPYNAVEWAGLPANAFSEANMAFVPKNAPNEPATMEDMLVRAGRCADRQCVGCAWEINEDGRVDKDHPHAGWLQPWIAAAKRLRSLWRSNMHTRQPTLAQKGPQPPRPTPPTTQEVSSRPKPVCMYDPYAAPTQQRQRPFHLQSPSPIEAGPSQPRPGLLPSPASPARGSGSSSPLNPEAAEYRPPGYMVTSRGDPLEEPLLPMPEWRRKGKWRAA